MNLTVLGKSPSWQDLDGACSGYLIELDGLSILLDCGSGAFAKLREFGSYERLDAVIISHLHADHVLDLVPFASALIHGPPLRDTRPALHAPPGASETLRQLCGLWGTPALIDDAFEVREYDPAAELVLARARLRFQPVPHYVPCNAIEVRGGADAASRRLVFSADCGPNGALPRFAEGADLLLIEATQLEDDPRPNAGHLSGAQAGAIGARAGAARVVLTHFSDQLDRERLAASASAALGHPVELAAEGATYTL